MGRTAPPPVDSQAARRVHEFRQAWSGLTNTDGETIYTIHHEPGRSISLLKADLDELLAAREALGELVEWFGDNLSADGQIRSTGITWPLLPSRVREIAKRFGSWYQ